MLGEVNWTLVRISYPLLLALGMHKNKGRVRESKTQVDILRYNSYSIGPRYSEIDLKSNKGGKLTCFVYN